MRVTPLLLLALAGCTAPGPILVSNDYGHGMPAIVRRTEDFEVTGDGSNTAWSRSKPAARPQTSTSKQDLAHLRSGHLASKPLRDAIELMGAPMQFSRNEEIYGEGEPADYLYKVVSGTVRTYKVLSDGRRQIGAFHMAASPSP